MPLVSQFSSSTMQSARTLELDQGPEQCQSCVRVSDVIMFHAEGGLSQEGPIGGGSALDCFSSLPGLHSAWCRM
jgi:hypothetical protein